MAQILRAHQSEIRIFVRSYGTQRRIRNYYEILRLQPGATQKEIKEAFIKLSKQAHPDISGKNSHDEFVKINEAYTALSKESTRRQYDMSQRSAAYRDDYMRRAYPGARRASDYASAQDIYQTYYANRNRWHSERHPHSNAWEDFRWSAHRRDVDHDIKMDRHELLGGMTFLVIVFFLIGLVVVESHREHYKSTLEKSRKNGRDYNDAKKLAEGRTLDEQIDRFCENIGYNKPDEK